MGHCTGEICKGGRGKGTGGVIVGRRVRVAGLQSTKWNIRRSRYERIGHAWLLFGGRINCPFRTSTRTYFCYCTVSELGDSVMTRGEAPVVMGNRGWSCQFGVLDPAHKGRFWNLHCVLRTCVISQVFKHSAAAEILNLPWLLAADPMIWG